MKDTKLPLLLTVLLLLFISCSNLFTDDALDNVKPVGVLLSKPDIVFANAALLNWTKAKTEKFISYAIFYDTIGNVSNKHSVLAGDITMKDTTSFLLTGLRQNTDYYIRIYVYSSSSSGGSNEISFTTSRCTCGVFTGEKNGNMVRIPAGCFIGKDGSIGLISNDYFMDTTEVAEELWYSIVNDSVIHSTKPITAVSWNEALLFCNKRSKKENYDTCFSYTSIIIDTIDSTIRRFENLACDFKKDGFRLPTEDEWEYAYRAGAWHEFYWKKDGNTLPYPPWTSSYPTTREDSLEISEYAWWSYNNKDTLDWYIGLKDVALQKPNPWCLYDIAGNAEEFLWDIASSYRPESRFDYTGPKFSPESGDKRVMRGGQYNHKALLLCAWYRENKITPDDYSGGGVGFRCVRTAE